VTAPAIIQERMKAKPFAVPPKPFEINELASRVRACADAQE